MDVSYQSLDEGRLADLGQLVMQEDPKKTYCLPVNSRKEGAALL